MTSRAEILEAMQFEFIQDLNPVNTSDAARYTMSYQFAGNSAPGDLPTSSTFSGWTAMTSAEKAAMRGALSHIETFLNVRFVEVTGQSDPDLNLGKVSLPGATAGLAGPNVSFFGNTVSRYDAFAVFDTDQDLATERSQNLILHELGHALGLKHPFHDGHDHGDHDDHALPDAEENNKYTVMSYTANPDNNAFSDAMMLYDLFALQDIWGAADYNTGANTYTGSRTDTIDVIWDTQGRDTLDASHKSDAVRLDLRQGAFSSFDAIDDVAIAFGTRIEDAIGGSDKDRLIGNARNNELRGGDDIDVLAGMQGNDRLRGENGADRLFGHSGNDLLIGGAGRDRLEGGADNDRLFGGNGADTFIYKNLSDQDTVLDFRDDVDTLLFIGHGTKEQVLSRADAVGTDVVFDFGDGHTLTVLNTNVSQLTDDVAV